MTLRTPSRIAKPRTTGRTNLLDKGMGLATMADLLAVAADYIDLVKIGWGTALVLPDLDARLELFRSHDIDICCGGTLFEYAYVTDQVEGYVDWLKERGLRHVEVSDGTITMEPTEKLKAIERLAADFHVLSEVGSKDADAIVSPARWVKAIVSEMEAGATDVILEGRESGTAGLYRKSGEMRTGLVDEVLDSGIDPHRLIFETPQKGHQVYLLNLLGVTANFANIAPEDAIPLETLRRGLRSDTLSQIHEAPASS
jgi:phosphosulfolactate synthase